MKRLKIGIFMDNYFPSVDGVVLVVENLAKQLSKYNDVTLVVPYTKSASEDKNKPFKIYRIRSIRIPIDDYRLGVNSIKQFNDLCNEHFDIIHIHSPFVVGRIGLKVAKKQNIPCISTMHTRFDFEFRKRLNNDLAVNKLIKYIIKPFNESDKCIAINHAMVKVFKDFGYTKEPTIIYNGTDLDTVDNPSEAIKTVNEKFKIKKDERVFLFVGRIVDIKNVFFILDVLKELDKEKLNFKMLFVGTGPDFKKLEYKVKEYNLEDKVILTGKILDRELLSKIYYRADLFLFPSLFDASSLVQIEAASQYTPSVFIKGSVTADTITPGFNGFASDNSIIAYKDLILDILSNERKLKEVSKNAKDTLARKWETIAYDTYALYLETMEAKNESNNN